MKNLITYLNEAKSNTLHKEILQAKEDLQDYIFKVIDASKDDAKKLLKKWIDKYTFEEWVDYVKHNTKKNYNGPFNFDWRSQINSSSNSIFRGWNNNYDGLDDKLNSYDDVNWFDLHNVLYSTCIEALDGDTYWDDTSELSLSQLKHIDIALYLIIKEYLEK